MHSSTFPPASPARRWLHTVLLLGLLAGCGGGDHMPGAPTPDPAPGPTAASFTLLPARLGLAIGGEGRLLVFDSPAAVRWTSSDPAVANVDAQGQVSAVAEGSAVITATAGAASRSSTVKVYAATALSAPALIGAALADRRINAEQALAYRVFALFADERLPAEYQGAPSGGPQHALLRELMTTIGSLSPEVQAQLRPFLVPPIYAESWFAQRLGLKAAAGAQRADPIRATRLAADAITCHAVGFPYQQVATEHFVVHYLGGAGMQEGTPEVVALVASLAEEVYTADTGLLKRFPLDDSAQACNGGDGKYDIYVMPATPFGLGAWTTTHLAAADSGRVANVCANQTTYMMLNSMSADFLSAAKNPQRARLMVKSILAHEFLHALQFAMDRQASCTDSKWFDEATAQWVMDFVVPSIPQGDPGEFGMEPGVGNVAPGYAKSGPALADYLYAGHLVSIERPAPGADPDLYGYSDYLFFQYLARSRSPDTIRQIFDAMAGGRNSVEAVAAAVDLKTVWPDFAKTLWIGFEDKVLDYWANEDEYRFGLAQVYAQVPTLKTIDQKLKDAQKSMKVDQKGLKTARFPLLNAALAFSGQYEIEPRSVLYEHLKFTDPTVRAVVFDNPLANQPGNGVLKLQALRKVAGKWQAPEDWTNEGFKTYCLDNQDERLEELLLIVSNSEAHRGSETPFLISGDFPMKVVTSNIGCWRWFGTASLTTRSAAGFTTVESMEGDFYRVQELSGVPLALVGLDVFIANSPSQITYNISGPLGATGCTISGSGTANQQAPGEGSMIINYLTLDGPPLPLERMVIGTGTTTVPGVVQTVTCAGKVETQTLDMNVHWLSLPEEGVPVSADGQTISGTWTRIVDGDTLTSVWTFKLVRD